MGRLIAAYHKQLGGMFRRQRSQRYYYVVADGITRVNCHKLRLRRFRTIIRGKIQYEGSEAKQQVSQRSCGISILEVFRTWLDIATADSSTVTK